jgi:phytanoyl-CoA hydroxylase
MSASKSRTQLQAEYYRLGFVLIKSFFDPGEIRQVREDAKRVFANQMYDLSILPAKEVGERQFEAGMFEYFRKDIDGFINSGKTCQHLISLHRLALKAELVDQITRLGVTDPVICTRPVIYFNSKHLAKSEVYYKTPAHQDWRSMQGALNAIVVWVPLVDIGEALGALQIIPQSHLWGLQASEPDEWFRRINNLEREGYESVQVEAGDALFFSAFVVHRSGNNVTDFIRWSCHFRYNDLSERTFIDRKYPNPYLYQPQQALITENFPSPQQLQAVFPTSETHEKES